MPPHDMDNNGLVFAVRDQDGNLITLQEATEDIRTEPVNYQRYNNFEENMLSCKIALHKVHLHGLTDILFGKVYTNAAKRYMRSVKRYKEKERRERLKGSGRHED